MNWPVASAFAGVLIIAGWITPGYVKRVYGMEVMTFVVWYYLAIVIGVTAFVLAKEAHPLDKLFPSAEGVAFVMGIGLSCAVAAHILLFGAVASGPNPGLGSLIANSVSSAGAVVAAVWLGRHLPEYFDAAEVDQLQTTVAIVLIVAGGYLLATAKHTPAS